MEDKVPNPDGRGAQPLSDMDMPVARRMIGFHLDEEGHWVAQLECGHNQHVRHTPPWIIRPWVVSAEGRAAALNETLPCKKCSVGAPADFQPPPQ